MTFEEEPGEEPEIGTIKTKACVHPSKLNCTNLGSIYIYICTFYKMNNHLIPYLTLNLISFSETTTSATTCKYYLVYIKCCILMVVPLRTGKVFVILKGFSLWQWKAHAPQCLQLCFKVVIYHYSLTPCSPLACIVQGTNVQGYRA